MRPFSRFDSSPDRPGQTGESHQNLVGPSAHWTAMRRHGQSEVLANKARNYILQMLNQESKNPPR